MERTSSPLHHAALHDAAGDGTGSQLPSSTNVASSIDAAAVNVELLSPVTPDPTSLSSPVGSPPSSSYSTRPPPVSSYYSSDDPHHSLMESSYVKATSSPLLSPHPSRPSRKCILGICAMDKKTRSKPMTQILDRLRAYGEFVVVIFGDALLLDDSVPVEEWPVADCLISFSSKGFPLPKVIDYVRLRKPFCVNDVPSQTALLDRREVYQILEKNKIPTPRHLYVVRTAQPMRTPSRATVSREGEEQITAEEGMASPLTSPTSSSSMVLAAREDVVEEFLDHITINGHRMNKPLVEKPMDADDHSVIMYASTLIHSPLHRLSTQPTSIPASLLILSHLACLVPSYYSPAQGGGSRRLFRKVGNRSSRFYPKVNSLRRHGSYIYEELFMNGKGAHT